MDPAILDLVKTIFGTVLSAGAVTGFYLMYRKFEAERAAALRQDNIDLREENRKVREENKALREENHQLREAERKRDERDEQEERTP